VFTSSHPKDPIERQSTFCRNDAPWGLARISSREMLSGSSDTALDFKYKYDSTGGSGVSVYVIGKFLALSISCTSTHRGQQTQASSSITPHSVGVPYGGKPSGDTQIWMKMATARSVPESLFPDRSVLPSLPTPSLSRFLAKTAQAEVLICKPFSLVVDGVLHLHHRTTVSKAFSGSRRQQSSPTNPPLLL